MSSSPENVDAARVAAKNKTRNRGVVIGIVSAIIILLTLVAFVPLAATLLTGSGVNTDGLSDDHAKPASTDVNGSWQVVKGSPQNFTSVGFTFNEVLPVDKRTTSGSTTKVEGTAQVSDGVLTSSQIEVDMSTLTTDKQVRDQNMKTKLFEVTKYPKATFQLTKPVDLNNVPSDGSAAKLELTGDLTIKDKTKSITQEFDILRDGKDIVISAAIPINRLEFDVLTPEFLAAKVEENGLVNVRVSLSKQ